MFDSSKVGLRVLAPIFLSEDKKGEYFSMKMCMASGSTEKPRPLAIHPICNDTAAVCILVDDVLRHKEHRHEYEQQTNLSREQAVRKRGPEERQGSE